MSTKESTGTKSPAQQIRDREPHLKPLNQLRSTISKMFRYSHIYTTMDRTAWQADSIDPRVITQERHQYGKFGHGIFEASVAEITLHRKEVHRDIERPLVKPSAIVQSLIDLFPKGLEPTTPYPDVLEDFIAWDDNGLYFGHMINVLNIFLTMMAEHENEDDTIDTVARTYIKDHENKMPWSFLLVTFSSATHGYTLDIKILIPDVTPIK